MPWRATASDADLLVAHAAGDPDAFGEVVRRHRDRLWAVALRTLGDREEAADALQDGLVSAFRAGRTGSAAFRGEAAVTTWLHRIVVNACLDRVRRSAARPPTRCPTTTYQLGELVAARETGLDVPRRWPCCRWSSGPPSSWSTCTAGRCRTPRKPSSAPRDRQEPLRPRPGPPAAAALARSGRPREPRRPGGVPPVSAAPPGRADRCPDEVTPRDGGDPDDRPRRHPPADRRDHLDDDALADLQEGLLDPPPTRRRRTTSPAARPAPTGPTGWPACPRCWPLPGPSGRSRSRSPRHRRGALGRGGVGRRRGRRTVTPLDPSPAARRWACGSCRPRPSWCSSWPGSGWLSARSAAAAATPGTAGGGAAERRSAEKATEVGGLPLTVSGRAWTGEQPDRGGARPAGARPSPPVTRSRCGRARRAATRAGPTGPRTRARTGHREPAPAARSAAAQRRPRSRSASRPWRTPRSRPWRSTWPPGTVTRRR